MQFLILSFEKFQLIFQMAMHGFFNSLGTNPHHVLAQQCGSCTQNPAAQTPQPHGMARSRVPAMHGITENPAVVYLMLERFAEKWQQ